MGLFKRKSDKSTNGTADLKDSSAATKVSSRPNMNGSPAANAVIPDIPIPRAPDPALDPAAYLRSIQAVRERSRYVLEKAKRNKLTHFVVDMSKFPETARYVVSIINVRN